MALDIPRVEYNHKDKSVLDNPKRIDPNDPSIKLQEEANRRARERRKENEWKKLKLSDLETQTNTEHNG